MTYDQFIYFINNSYVYFDYWGTMTIREMGLYPFLPLLVIGIFYGKRARKKALMKRFILALLQLVNMIILLWFCSAKQNFYVAKFFSIFSLISLLIFSILRLMIEKKWIREDQSVNIADLKHKIVARLKRKN